jgi:hypothetical protein
MATESMADLPVSRHATQGLLSSITPKQRKWLDEQIKLYIDLRNQRREPAKNVARKFLADKLGVAISREAFDAEVAKHGG